MSRWGKAVSGGGGGDVSDDAALAALLASAEQRQAQKAAPKNTNRHKSGGGGGGGAVAGGAGGEKRDYYGPSGAGGGGGSSADGQRKRQRRWGGKSKEEPIPDLAWGSGAAKAVEGSTEQGDEGKQVEKKKADFGLSGALASDERTGNVYNGILLKFSEPPEARAPNTRWRLYVFRKKKENDAGKSGGGGGGGGDDGELIETLHVSRQSAYLFGREAKVADIPVLHPSLSSQHCVLQYRATPDASIGGRLRCRPYLMDLESTNGTFVNGVRLESARYYELRKGDVITLGASTREYVLLTENSTEAGTGVGA